MNTRLINKLNSLKHLDRKFNHKENVIKVRKGETLNHFLAKCLLAYEEINNGNSVITEAIFNNGKRADLLILETGLVYEVLESEKIENIIKKQVDYPFPIKPFKCDFVINAYLNKLGFEKKRNI